MATLQTVRRWIMTGAVAAITITGTIYGAGLKGQQELKQVCQPYRYFKKTSFERALCLWRLFGLLSLVFFFQQALILTILQQKRQVLQATPEERIAQLEVTRAELVLKKNEMERKIAMVAEKKRAREQEQTDGR